MTTEQEKKKKKVWVGYVASGVTHTYFDFVSNILSQYSNVFQKKSKYAGQKIRITVEVL